MKRPTLAVAALLVAACLVATGGMATPKRQLRVGFVTFAGVVPTARTLDGQALAGFLRADKRLGINGRVVFVGPTQDPVRALAGLARQDYDLVISSIPYEEPPKAAARQFPRVRFLITDAPNAARPPPQKRRTDCLPRGGGRVSRRLPGCADGEPHQRQACDQRCRRHSVSPASTAGSSATGRARSEPTRASPSGSTIRRTSATPPSASESPAARSPRDRARSSTSRVPAASEP